MGNRGIDLIKDFVTSILVVLGIILIIAVFFYDKLSLTQAVPESEDYMLSAEMEKGLKDKILETTQEVIVNYQIDASDLKKYEKTNEYTKGKSSPFAQIIENPVNGMNPENNLTSPNQNNGIGNFFDDDGTK